MAKVPNKTSKELLVLIQSQLNEQLGFEAKGDYVSAESCRLQGQQLRRDYEERSLYEMDQMHAKQTEELNRGHNEQLDRFNKFWNHQTEQYTKQGHRLESEMMQKHDTQIEKLKEDLNRQLPLKVKESSQLLNLRKMEAHMAKQKNYVEAHRVQCKINDLEKSETQAWHESRDNKINTALNNRRSQNATQLANLRKRIQTGLEQQAKDRHVQLTRLNQKYNNNLKEMNSRHDKQVLSFKGHFRAKGGNSGPSSPMQKKMKS